MNLVEVPDEQKAHPSRGMKRLMECHSRRLAWCWSALEDKHPFYDQRKRTINFKEKTLQEKHFSDILPAKN